MSVLPSLGVNVSRETLADLELYQDLLLKWTPKINLISKSSVPHVWDRHIWDSAQIYPLIEHTTKLTDIGSGGGLPALVVAIFAKHKNPDLHVTMIESDIRKSAFLRTVVRDLSLNAEVKSDRVERLPAEKTPVLTARALADLTDLLEFAAYHLVENGVAYFLKGENWQKEVSAAQKSWSFTLEPHKSKTNPEAAILEIRNIKRV